MAAEKDAAGQTRRLLEICGLVLGHVAAVAVGFVMMVLGLGLGVDAWRQTFSQIR